MNKKTYAIFWLAPETQRFGLGKAQFTREEAELLAAELNEDHPSFIHTAIDTATEDIHQVTARLQAEFLNPRSPKVIQFPELAASDAASREVVGL